MNSFIYTLFLPLTSDLHYPVSTKQQFSRDSSALELHSAIALIKPSESTSGLLICYFLRPALQRKSHLPVKWFFCLQNEKFCFKRDTLDNQGPVMGLATCLPSCCEEISSLLALCCSPTPPTPPTSRRSPLKASFLHRAATQLRWQQPATGGDTQ